MHAVPWYARLTQRVVSALTVATRKGGLYDVDLRLRPSGGKGPLATQARGFLAYQTGEAETWEHMALTRARVVAGDAGLGVAIGRAIRAIIARPRDKAVLIRDIAAMRALVANEKGEADPADLKLVAGGILDIEFIQQYLVLLHAAAHPGLAVQSPTHILAAIVAAGLLSPGDGAILIAAQRLYEAVTQIQRLTLDDASNPALAGEGVKRRIAAAAGLPDYARLTRELAETRVCVRAIFSSLLPLEPPAAKFRGKKT